MDGGKNDFLDENVNVYANEQLKVSKTWTAVSLTHVEYIKGDMIGQILAWCSLLPMFILVAFATLVLFRRDLHTICYAVGLVLDEAINWLLKHSIKESRPPRDQATVLYSEYGMPSSHSQFIWFFTTYLITFIFIRLYRNTNILDELWKYAVASIALLVSTAVAYSRVYLGYHTVSQVLWGCMAGTTLGALWFLVVQLLLTPLFPIIAAWPVSEYLMVRDSTLIPNVMWFEYTSSRVEAKRRLRKVKST